MYTLLSTPHMEAVMFVLCPLCDNPQSLTYPFPSYRIAPLYSAIAI